MLIPSSIIKIKNWSGSVNNFHRLVDCREVTFFLKRHRKDLSLIMNLLSKTR